MGSLAVALGNELGIRLLSFFVLIIQIYQPSFLGEVIHDSCGKSVEHLAFDVELAGDLMLDAGEPCLLADDELQPAIDLDLRLGLAGVPFLFTAAYLVAPLQHLDGLALDDGVEESVDQEVWSALPTEMRLGVVHHGALQKRANLGAEHRVLAADVGQHVRLLVEDVARLGCQLHLRRPERTGLDACVPPCQTPLPEKRLLDLRLDVAADVGQLVALQDEFLAAVIGLYSTLTLRRTPLSSAIS